MASAICAMTGTGIVRDSGTDSLWAPQITQGLLSSIPSRTASLHIVESSR